MHRIDTPTAQTDKFGAGKNGFTRGNPQTGVPATALDDDYFDAIQEEIAGVIESTGAPLNKNNRAQLLAAINAIIANGGAGFLKKNSNLSDLPSPQTALTNLGLTGIGIGLPAQSAIANFDWLNFVFTSGANYLTTYSSWINPPVGLTFTAGSTVSITVNYISGSRVGLTVIPDTTTQTNYRVYKVLGVGAPGSRVFTVREDWNSANPIPISGGGTGATTTDGAIANLELGEGSLVPIGIPLPYPQATPPSGYLKCNGSSFSTTTYPRLALRYPSGVLPDIRSNVIRAWDDGRGIDPARALLTEQMGSYLIHEWTANNAVCFYSGNGVGLEEDPIIGAIPALDAKLVTAGGTFRTSSNHLGIARMRNISFNYIVRAL